MAVFRDHSSYYYQLPAAAAHRYDEIISVIGNVDPYIIDNDCFHDDEAGGAGGPIVRPTLIILFQVPLLLQILMLTVVMIDTVDCVEVTWMTIA